MRYRQELQVPLSYDVVFTRDLFASTNETIAETLPRGTQPARAAFFIDESVQKRWPALNSKIAAWCEAHADVLKMAGAPMTVPGGEAVKNDLTFVQRMTHQYQRLGLCRHSYVFAIGGGAVLDAVGLSAAVFHRGLRLIRVPTTVLSQNDSGVGVKNGVNLDGVKNMIGTFATPYAVLNDSFFLTTLEQRDWVSGLSETFKVAIIKDLPLLEELEHEAARLVARSLEAMERVVQRCAIIHLEHIRTGGDPFEFGSSRPLDFGHWSAHKLESMTHYALRHGEAVAIGIALDMCCAEQMKFISAAQRDRVLNAMNACGLSLWNQALTRRNPETQALQVLDGLEEFRQHLGGKLTLTMPNGLGSKLEIHELPAEIVENAIDYLQAESLKRDAQKTKNSASEIRKSE